MKRKRGRPKKVFNRFFIPALGRLYWPGQVIPLEQLKNKKKLSELTKWKISENNKKFSVCKLCGRQCRGFRGLVDHMHRSEEQSQNTGK